ncbi:MAG: O-antigen ligase family protein [Desulfobacteraceae bacterium]|nr:O-antigen ligase family protein [Desulfobacteraceae bacterium]
MGNAQFIKGNTLSLIGSNARHKLVSRLCLWLVLIGLIVLIPIEFLYPRDNFLSQGRAVPILVRAFMFVVMFGYSIDMLTRDGLRQLPTVCKSFLLLSLLIGIHVAVLVPKHPEFLRFYIIHLYWVLGLIFFYYLTASGIFNRKQLARFICIFIPFAVLFTFIEVFRWRSLTGIPGANAYAYPLLWCLPVLLIAVRGWPQIILASSSVFAILFTLKRGAILALLICCFVYVIRQWKMHNTTGMRRAIVTILLIGIIGAVVATSLWDRVQERTLDLQNWESAGSGRGTIYSVLWSNWVQGDMFNKVFGCGYRAMPRLLWSELLSSSFNGQVAIRYAHSDWLAVLHDYGLLGVCVLINIHISLLLFVREAFRAGVREAVPLLLTYLICFCIHAYSGNIDYSTTIYFSLGLGFLSGQIAGKTRCRNKKWSYGFDN